MRSSSKAPTIFLWGMLLWSMRLTMSRSSLGRRAILPLRMRVAEALVFCAGTKALVAPPLLRPIARSASRVARAWQPQGPRRFSIAGPTFLTGVSGTDLLFIVAVRFLGYYRLLSVTVSV